MPTIMWCTCDESCEVYVAHLVHTATLDLYNTRLGEVWGGNPLDAFFHEAPPPTGIIYINIIPIYIYIYAIWIHVAYTHMYKYIYMCVRLYVCAHWHPSCTVHMGHVVRSCGASYAYSHTWLIHYKIVKYKLAINWMRVSMKLLNQQTAMELQQWLT